MEDKQQKSLGLYVIGQIISKNRYPGQQNKPERFALDVAIPGCRELLSIAVDAVQFAAAKEMAVFTCQAILRTYNGRVYFTALSKEGASA